MSDTPPGTAITAAAANLTTALTGMTAELRTVNARQKDAERYARRNRALIWAVFGSVAAEAILAVLLVLSYGASQAANARATAATVRATAASVAVTVQHQNLLASCAAGNRQRAAQVVVWDKVLGATRTNLSTQTPAGRDLLAFIRSTFRPRICAQVYKTP